jgi:hypothetical protein
MFSLIITITSIALVAALALATLYYGGDSFNKGQTESTATTVVNHVQQLIGAKSLFKAEKPGEALTLTKLVANNYLKSAPALHDKTWTSLSDMGETVWLPLAIDKETCKAVNKKLVGTDGIPELPVSTWNAHCFGKDNQYSVIVGDATYVENTTAIPQSLVDVYADKGVAFTQSSLPTGIPASESGYWSDKPTLTPWSSSGGGSAPSAFQFDLHTETFNVSSFTLKGINTANIQHVMINCPYSEGALGFTQADVNIISSDTAELSWYYINSGPCTKKSSVLSNAIRIYYQDGTSVSYPATLSLVY